MGIAAAASLVTVVLQAEVALLFHRRRRVGHSGIRDLFASAAGGDALLVAVPAAPVASSTILGKLLVFFLKAGALTFGSGLVIVPFLQQGVVQEHGWLGATRVPGRRRDRHDQPWSRCDHRHLCRLSGGGLLGRWSRRLGIFLPSFILVLARGADPGAASRQSATSRDLSKVLTPRRSARFSAPAFS